MKHLNEMTNISSEKVETGSSRRRFLSYFSVGAASLALQACGGGAGALSIVYTPAAANAPQTPPPSTVTQPPSTTPPVTTTPTSPAAPPISLATIPDLNFVQGVPSSVSLVQWISGADPATVQLTLNAVALPAGVSYDAVAKALTYDGIGAPSTSGGYVLTAMNA